MDRNVWKRDNVFSSSFLEVKEKENPSYFDDRYGNNKQRVTARMLLGLGEEEGEDGEEGEAGEEEDMEGRGKERKSGREGGIGRGKKVESERKDMDDVYASESDYNEKDGLIRLDREDDGFTSEEDDENRTEYGNEYESNPSSIQNMDRRSINNMQRGELRGEETEKWRVKVREKRDKREEERRRLMSELEEGGQEWKEERLEWMVKEIRVMKPAPLVRFLNLQRGWICMEDVHVIIHASLEKKKGPRAVKIRQI